MIHEYKILLDNLYFINGRVYFDGLGYALDRDRGKRG